MLLTNDQAEGIVVIAHGYISRKFCFETFNCVHFVREVYSKAGIDFPRLAKDLPPPADFHLSSEKFAEMPIGHSAFFKRRGSKLVNRLWTHVAIVFGENELIHCTRNLGDGVVITPRPIFLEMYVLSPLTD